MDIYNTEVALVCSNVAYANSYIDVLLNIGLNPKCILTNKKNYKTKACDVKVYDFSEYVEFLRDDYSICIITNADGCSETFLQQLQKQLLRRGVEVFNYHSPLKNIKPNLFALYINQNTIVDEQDACLCHDRHLANPIAQNIRGIPNIYIIGIDRNLNLIDFEISICNLLKSTGINIIHNSSYDYPNSNEQTNSMPFVELLKKISFNPILLSSENYEMSIGDSPTVRIIGVPLDFFTYTEGLNSESEAFWKTFTTLFPANCLITVLYSDIEYITQFKEMKVISEKVFGRSSDLFLCRKNCSGFVEKSLTEGNLLNIDDEGTDIIYRVIKSLHINLSSIE